MEVKQILSAFFSVLSASSNALLIKAFPICFFLLLSVGMPLADALCMILVIMQMKVPSEKRKELFQDDYLAAQSHQDCRGMPALRFFSQHGG